MGGTRRDWGWAAECIVREGECVGLGCAPGRVRTYARQSWAWWGDLLCVRGKARSRPRSRAGGLQAPPSVSYPLPPFRRRIVPGASLLNHSCAPNAAKAHGSHFCIEIYAVQARGYGRTD